MKKLSLILIASLFISIAQAQTKHTVGEKYGGGIVFYVDSTGQHGLIAAERDLSGKYTWQKAKEKCQNLRLNGFNDWYLPNKEEMNKLYLNQAVVGGFASGDYWSSSENDNKSAWSQSFSNGNKKKYYSFNGTTMNVRAGRAF